MMATLISFERLRFLFNRLKERLWVRPLVVCLLSVSAVLSAKLADGTPLGSYFPELSIESVQALLSIMSASMLVIATFSVGSMISAYSSTSNTATPRAFSLVLADDVSKNALSTFVGSFIFSVVAITAVKNAFYGKASLFVLFVLTVVVFAMVIVTFVRWVDSIARLGRVGSTIEKVDNAALASLLRRRNAPLLGGIPITEEAQPGKEVHCSRIGYVQHIDMVALQAWAEEFDVIVEVVALPGTFTAPNQVLAYVRQASQDIADKDLSRLTKAFQIGDDRLFDDDPRFGLVVLSEIAGRALSPGINDPGTAIKIIGTLIRLISQWNEPAPDNCHKKVLYDRVAVPSLSVPDMFDDAFTVIARDGAGVVEVAVRLQKALCSLASLGDEDISKSAEYHAGLALKRARKSLDIEEDIAHVEKAAEFWCQ
ncbi:DUF2254 domain-containing protein [Aliidiomarina taiwanensis]|uniref:DUF2254 domain-containing protein n=1 Tax=Aliidiomarina taiwanensis TaxID=946228 RepID=A0A432X158_9GAMM|nr:DUF2254 domain-containing protein [Aliidiomarina taiwanensis]RUO39777.1 DUF2254 domain-containing protein [Aliidiomarina taiwanensis]